MILNRKEGSKMEEKITIIMLDENGIEEDILLPMNEVDKELSLSQLFEGENAM